MKRTKILGTEIKSFPLNNLEDMEPVESVIHGFTAEEKRLLLLTLAPVVILGIVLAFILTHIV